MNNKVADYIRTNNMLSKGDGVVAGVSGGADSMCLLHILIGLRNKYDLKILAVHVNHGIRGASADADERFVGAFCLEKGVEFKAYHVNIPELAKESGMTEEEAGRAARYRCFREACVEKGFSKIAVAHNMDDNAETVLFNIARGSGISGLRGILPVRDDGGITLIRPLLTCSRAMIEEYLSAEGLEYRTDETNLTCDYSRNRIRNVILPMLRENVNSGVSEHLAALAGQACELEELADSLSCEAIEEMEKTGAFVTGSSDGRAVSVSIASEALLSMQRAVRTAVIRRIISMLAGRLKDIQSTHIRAAQALLYGRTGSRADLPYGIRVFRDHDRLVFDAGGNDHSKHEGMADERELSAPGEYELEDGRILKLNVFPYEKKLNIPRNDYTKYFDYDKIVGKLVLRTRREGDFILIKSKKDSDSVCRKTLKTWFIDKRIPARERDCMPLVAAGDHVLWIIGCRGDDSCYVTEQTRRVLEVSVQSRPAGRE